MQQIITAKLKLLTSPEQHQALRRTQLAYREALNYVSVYAFTHGKTSNEKRLREGTYYKIRTQFKLPSEMTNNAIRQVGATYKGLWTKVKKNNEHRRKKLQKNDIKAWINLLSMYHQLLHITTDMITVSNLSNK